MLDGVDNNETWLQTVVIFPSVDALDEFKLQTSHLLGGVRPVARRRRQPADQVGHATASTAAASSSTATTRSTPTTSSTTAPAAPSRTSSRTSSAAPSAARSSRTRRSSSATTRATASTQGADVPVDRADAGDADRRFLRAEPRHLRPARPVSRSRATSFRATASIPVARNILDAAVSGAEHRRHDRQPTGRSINNYLINPINEPRGQPVRRQGRPQPDATATGSSSSYSYQKTHRIQPATLPHGDAGVDVRRRRRQHQGAEPGASTTRTPFGTSLLNEFRFGWSSIKFFMTPIDYGTNPADRRGPSRHQPQSRRRRR